MGRLLLCPDAKPYATLQGLIPRLALLPTLPALTALTEPSRPHNPAYHVVTTISIQNLCPQTWHHTQKEVMVLPIRVLQKHAKTLIMNV